MRTLREIDNIDDFTLDPREPVFTTGVVSRLLSIPVWVLKQLDNEGIVRPPRKSENVSRLYTVVQVKKVKRCWYYLSQKGVKVKALKIILEMEKKMEG
ncbi:MAG: MerR family transcriptional regulator [Candidatus Omnitrophica bacterium]|nr:MerR family transcriptional regulator [Candidatus Omnitrophota bacterium]